MFWWIVVGIILFSLAILGLCMKGTASPHDAEMARNLREKDVRDEDSDSEEAHGDE